MDYKKKYEESLENLKRIKEANIDNQELVEFIEFKYPELSENETEDERIKKALIRFFSKAAECDSSTYGIKDRNIIAWLEKQGLLNNDKYQTVPVEILDRLYKSEKELEELKQGEQKSIEPVTVIERDGEKWVRVCAFGEDFIIAAHDYRDGNKTEFTWEEACNIGTFSKKQGYIILALLNEINAKLEEIGGEPLSSYYWSSSEYNSAYAWYVYFSSGNVNYYHKSGSYVARAVAAF